MTVRIVPGWLFPCGLLFTTASFQLNAAEKDSAAGTLCFESFVNWDFHHRQKLRAWKITAEVIEQTLDGWNIRRPARLLVENGSPESFRQFLGTLPDKNSCDISLVYLASHQSAAGEWDFTQKQTRVLDDIVTETTIPTHPRRIVIVDTCYAAAALRHSELRRKLGSGFLFVSTASEETPMVNFHTPQPVDFAHRYPSAFAWLKEHLDKKWDGKISFLGFVWAKTFLEAKNRPVDFHDWMSFLQKCQANAAEFGQNVSRKSSSQIILSTD